MKTRTLSTIPSIVIARTTNIRKGAEINTELVMTAVDELMFEAIKDLILKSRSTYNKQNSEQLNNLNAMTIDIVVNDKVVTLALSDVMILSTRKLANNFINYSNNIRACYGEKFSEWIPAGYNNETNKASTLHDGTVQIVNIFDPMDMFNYQLGRLGNPSHFIMYKRIRTREIN